MERSLYISKFRNIGFNKNSSNGSERIVLNHSLKKGEMGNLVIVIGANNSGKSNVLDALYNLDNKNIEQRDITTLSYEDKDRKPQLSLVCKDNDNEYVYRLTYNEKPYIQYPKKNIVPKITEEQLSNLSKEINNFKNSILGYANSYRAPNMRIYAEKCDKILDQLSEKNINKDMIFSNLKLMMLDFNNNRNNSYFNYAWNDFINKNHNGYIAQNFGKNPSEIDELNTNYSYIYGMPFIPQIIKYQEKQITNNMISCDSNYIESNDFFLAVFEKIGITIDKIKNTYNTFYSQNNKGALLTLQREINNKLKLIIDDFNKLYFADNDKYRFEITLESSKVYFSIFRGNNDLSLDYQSTGFKWFFNLYFNLLCKTTLNPGDIIIMDEPATNLHPRGQTELRNFLKDFSIKNDLTIVLATHSPFLIDLNYLDELRVVANIDNVSYIFNDFSTINMDDPDSLKPIKNALTVSNHVLFDPDKKVIFVEGITDYNYLLAFRRKLNITEDIIFLPIEGVGDITKQGYKDKQKQISKELITIKKHNPILLVDADGAGKSMAKVNEEDSNLTVKTLADINPEFKTIETLFSASDQTKYNLVQKNGKYIKSSTNSSQLKTFIDNYEFDDTTMANFKQVFDYIETL